MDFSKMTDEDLAAFSAGLMAEMQRRTAVRDLEDRVTNAVMDAKNMGYGKNAIAQALTNVLRLAFVGDEA